MTEGRVLISAHDLARARTLRTSFKELGYRTELVTADERLSPAARPELLVLTANAGETAHLRDQARELGLPLFVISEGRGENGSGTPSSAARSDAGDVFPASASDRDIASVGVRRIKARRLQTETGIIGETEVMREALDRVVRFGPVDATVLVTGESGTGKELFARGLHRLSHRRAKPFIPVNVAALSESLLESELFGHEKGAFTGAVDSRKGLFELAHAGTIFLDEIGEMPMSAQTNLLRVLEQREFHRVGGERMVHVDVRIVAATNQDLSKLVTDGDFRRDLYYRLNVLSIRLPPLRERRADVPALVARFMADSGERHGLAPPELTRETMHALMAHSWPGNVRELRNLVESMVILAPRAPKRALVPEDLPYDVQKGGSLGGGLALVPAARGSDGDPVPDWEVVLRTLVELRTELDDLRREFEQHRADGAGWTDGKPVIGCVPADPAAMEGELVEAFDVDEPSLSETPPGISLAGMTMEAIEREAIRTTLAATEGNRREAAKVLGIGERTLYRKITKYGLS